MIKKNLLFEKNLFMKISSGISQLSNAVKSTLGPGGNPVMIERKMMTPLITKDGVTVARNIALKDPFENLAVQAMIEVAEKTNQVAGDGTTTAIVLAEALYHEGRNQIGTEDPSRFIGLSNQFQLAANEIVDYLKENKKDVVTKEDVENIGTISANGDREIGKIISEAIDKVGQDGLITVEEAGFENELRFVEGFKIDRGYVSSKFVLDQSKKETVLENVNILLYDGEIHSVDNFMNAMQLLVVTQKPFLVIANEIRDEAKNFMVVNFAKGVTRGVGIKSPGYGATRSDMLQDIAILTGSKIISPDSGERLESVSAANFGSAKKVIIKKNETIIINGNGNADVIGSRVNELRSQISNVAEHAYDKDNLRDRISKLTGGAAVIGVGATTELEMKEKKDRIEDALNSTRAAIEEGILPGGGVALLKAVQCLKDKEDLGSKILAKVIQVPFERIMQNAGEDVAEIKKKVLANRAFDNGFDARNGKHGRLFKMGVIDPFKVVKNALLNAVSISSLLLTCKAAITIDPDEEKKIVEDPGMDGPGAIPEGF